MLHSAKDRQASLATTRSHVASTDRRPLPEPAERKAHRSRFLLLQHSWLHPPGQSPSSSGPQWPAVSGSSCSLPEIITVPTQDLISSIRPERSRTFDVRRSSPAGESSRLKNDCTHASAAIATQSLYGRLQSRHDRRSAAIPRDYSLLANDCSPPPLPRTFPTFCYQPVIHTSLTTARYHQNSPGGVLSPKRRNRTPGHV